MPTINNYNFYFKNEALIDTATFIGTAAVSTWMQTASLVSPLAINSYIFAGVSALTIQIAGKLLQKDPSQYKTLKFISIFTTLAINALIVPYFLSLGSFAFSMEAAAILAVSLGATKIITYLFFKLIEKTKSQTNLPAPQPTSWAKMVQSIKESSQAAYVTFLETKWGKWAAKADWKKIGLITGVGLFVVISSSLIARSLFSSTPPIVPKILQSDKPTKLIKAVSTALSLPMKNVFPFPQTSLELSLLPKALYDNGTCPITSVQPFVNNTVSIVKTTSLRETMNTCDIATITANPLLVKITSLTACLGLAFLTYQTSLLAKAKRAVVDRIYEMRIDESKPIKCTACIDAKNLKLSTILDADMDWNKRQVPYLFEDFKTNKRGSFFIEPGDYVAPLKILSCTNANVDTTEFFTKNSIFFLGSMIRKLKAGEKLNFTYKGRPIEILIQAQNPDYSFDHPISFEKYIDNIEAQLYYHRKGLSGKPILLSNDEVIDRPTTYPHPNIKEKDQEKKYALPRLRDEMGYMILHKDQATHFLFDTSKNTLAEANTIDFPDIKKIGAMNYSVFKDKRSVLLDMPGENKIVAISIFGHKLFIYRETSTDDLSPNSTHVAAYINLQEHGIDSKDLLKNSKLQLVPIFDNDLQFSGFYGLKW